MKKHLTFQVATKRSNTVKIFILYALAHFGEAARIVLEVFTRRDFGVRYFKFSSVIFVCLLLAIFPLRHMIGMGYHGGGRQEPTISDILWAIYSYSGWYVFIFAVMREGFKHHVAKKQETSIFDFSRYSKSTGIINPLFYKISIGKTKTDTRRVECFIEPGFFFVCGLVLFIIGQHLGPLLMVLSVSYSASYYLEYMAGDEYIMDIIDQILSNKWMEKSFVDGADASETQGVVFRHSKNMSSEVKRIILPSLIDEDDDFLEAS